MTESFTWREAVQILGRDEMAITVGIDLSRFEGRGEFAFKELFELAVMVRLVSRGVSAAHAKNLMDWLQPRLRLDQNIENRNLGSPHPFTPGSNNPIFVAISFKTDSAGKDLLAPIAAYKWSELGAFFEPWPDELGDRTPEHLVVIYLPALWLWLRARVDTVRSASV